MADIQTNEIDIWLVENDQLIDQSMLNDYLGLLNPDELKRLDRFVFPKHKKQFLISRALVRTVLGQYLEQSPESIVFARNAYGKPRIASFERSLPISFNLSHTNGLSVLAVSLNDELGVDTEYLTRKVDILNLAKRYFSEQEYAGLAALDVKDFDKRFLELWTLKEAYIKACGMGLAIPLKDFSFSFNDEKISINFSADRDDSPEHWQFWQFEFKSTFQLALAQNSHAKEKTNKLLIRQGKPLEGFLPFEPEKLVQSF